MNKPMRNQKLSLLVSLLALPVFCQAAWQPAEGPLKSRWAREVSPRAALPEYPRPQFVRKEWRNLNGLWDLAITAKDAPKPTSFSTQILVPYPVESDICKACSIDCE